MSTSHFVLMIESDPRQSEALAAQLVRIGIEPVRAADLDEAVEVVRSQQYSVCGVLVPSDLDGKALQRAMKTIRSFEPGLPGMAYGKVPDLAQRKLLRRAGVLLALWDGYDPGVLRFQINRLVSGENQTDVRASRRAPIHAPVRVEVGGRVKDGFLYSLSEGGCFIEIPRASMDGARLRMNFELEEYELEIEGVVAFANVPGNLQRPNLPLGMGVCFDDLPRAIRKAVNQFVQERIASLEV